MPDYFQWREDDSVGVRRFDEDHQAMLEQARRLILAYNEGEPGEVVQECMDNLIEYVVFHFEREEQQMREVDYPDYTAHLAEHNWLIRTALKFKSDLRYRRLEGDAVADLLADWVLRHIRQEDRKYTVYLNARGVR